MILIYTSFKPHSILLIKMVKTKFRPRRKRKTVSFFFCKSWPQIWVSNVNLGWVIVGEELYLTWFINVLNVFWGFNFHKLMLCIILASHTCRGYLTKCRNEYIFMQQFHVKISVMQVYITISFYYKIEAPYL